MALPRKKETLNAVIEDIFNLDNSRIDKSRKQQVTDFIVTTVNGDNPTAHLVTNANLGENIKGVIVYILTNLRLLKIDIDANEIKSSSFPLSTIIGIERKLIDGNRAQFSISFQNGSFGLRYDSSDQNITNFFQKIDQLRISDDKNGT